MSIKLTKKELLFISHATTDIGVYGIFDAENNTEEDFFETYGLSKKEPIKIAETLRVKVLKELSKQKCTIAQ